MDSRKKIVLILGLILFVGLFLWLLENSNGDKNRLNKPVYTSSNWEKDYQLDDKDPRDLYLFNSLLSAHLEKPSRNKRIYDWNQYDSLVKKDEKATYIFVGDELEMLNNEVDTLLSNVKKGSDLVLSFNDLSYNVYKGIFKNVEFEFDYGDSVTVFAGKKQYVLYNIYQTDTIANVWHIFGKFELLDSSYTILSSFMEMPNYIKIQHGKGNIYLHTNPTFFYNYQILRPDGFKYAAFFINHIPKKRNVYWLEVGRKMNNVGSSDTDEQEGSKGKEDDSYFKLLFKHPALMLAMLMVILGFVLFLIFRAKRMRPIVPYIEKKKNMTLSFADTITSIYFAKQNPKGLLRVQQKNFYNTVQKHFFVDLSRREGDREIRILSEKSNVPVEELIEFIEKLENKKVDIVDNKYISEVAKTQRDFYKKTGIISQVIQKRLEKHEKQYNRALWLPTLLILCGIYIVLLGFYYLVNSKGIGIILWPIGISWIVMGILRLRRPLAIITKEEIIICPILGKPKHYVLDELLNVQTTPTIVHFYFTQNRTFKINFWEMSRFDKKQFERYVSNLHTLEL